MEVNCVLVVGTWFYREIFRMTWRCSKLSYHAKRFCEYLFGAFRDKLSTFQMFCWLNLYWNIPVVDSVESRWKLQFSCRSQYFENTNVVYTKLWFSVVQTNEMTGNHNKNIKTLLVHEGAGPNFTICDCKFKSHEESRVQIHINHTCDIHQLFQCLHW